MGFGELPEELQEIILFNWEQTAKLLFLGLFLALSIYYLTQKKSEQPTPFFSVGFLRVVATSLSITYLTTFPLSLLMLRPGVSFMSVFLIIFIFYGGMWTLFGLVAVVDTLYIGPSMILRVAGLDMKSKRVREGMMRMFGYNGGKE